MSMNKSNELNLFDTGEINETAHKSPPKTILSKPKVKNDSVEANLNSLDKNLEYLSFVRKNMPPKQMKKNKGEESKSHSKCLSWRQKSSNSSNMSINRTRKKGSGNLLPYQRNDLETHQVKSMIEDTNYVMFNKK